MTSFNVRTADLAAINSMTKYPSIPTYHKLGERGALLDEYVPFAGTVIGTEKVDGCNGRVVLLPDGSYLIGSREELLYGSGDLVANPALGIVDALRLLADRLLTNRVVDRPTVYYAEVYGGKTTAASRQYTSTKQVGYRLFDIAKVDGFEEMLHWPSAQIAAWRDQGGQRFYSETALGIEADSVGAQLTPRLFVDSAVNVPTKVADTHVWLAQRLPATRVALDSGAGGLAEGIVLRTPDRSAIAKIRFQDYKRAVSLREHAH
ncbi:hypothetical protein I0C86_40555 [Plantactinospora sp. S1510]|uniref:RNA ligase domain-containing protein n=1 Tax=Plantactinospora alkalitolerans TaxID=2789879 RepID=A0ABS0HAF7_9ACTN|nr:RNA ligase family protein [Plantactinospora alkalitolerans]MBF9135173.1 hypothetical protein [Plantactinospora alkalitolerans]